MTASRNPSPACPDAPWLPCDHDDTPPATCAHDDIVGRSHYGGCRECDYVARPLTNTPADYYSRARADYGD